MIHDGDLVAEVFSLVHGMGGEDNGLALLLDGSDDLPEMAAGLGIKTGGRLVQKDQLRFIDQGQGQHQPLRLTAGDLVVHAGP